MAQQSNIPHIDALKAFAELRHTPVSQDGGPGVFSEMPAALKAAEGNDTPVSAKKAESDKLVPKMRVKHFSKTLVIWRDYEECNRCTEVIATDQITLPDDGAYTCKHTQLNEYKDIMDRCLGGDGAMLHKEHFSTPDGKRCVLIEWVEADPEFLEELKNSQGDGLETVDPLSLIPSSM